jgi:hypothetical protein
MFKKIFFLLTFVAVVTALPFWPYGTEANYAKKGVTVGDILPTIKAKSLAGGEVTLPTANGKATVLGLAFSPKAEGDLKTWMQPIYDTFLAKHEGVFEAGNFDGNVYLLAMLSGAASLGGKSLQDKAAKGTDAELRPHVLLTTQDAAEVAKAINATDKTKPYFVVLDATGHVKSVVSGTYTEAKMDELSQKAGEAE